MNGVVPEAFVNVVKRYQSNRFVEVQISLRPAGLLFTSNRNEPSACIRAAPKVDSVVTEPEMFRFRTAETLPPILATAIVTALLPGYRLPHHSTRR